MRKLIILSCLLVGSLTLAAQSGCYYPFELNKALSYQFYNSKDKLISSSEYLVTELNETDQGQEAKLNVKNYDKDGELQTTTDFTAICQDGQLTLDLINVLSPDMMKSMENLEVDIEGSPYIIPASLTVGDQLPDGQLSIAGSMNGIPVMKTNIDFKDRKVVAQEQISTPAGSFDCYKITYTLALNMLVTKNYQVTEWYAKGTGLIRSETYNKKGKLESYQTLVQVK